MTETEPTPPPQTGVPQVDEALRELVLGEDVSTHPAALAAAVEALQRALNHPGAADSGSGSRPTPG